MVNAGQRPVSNNINVYGSRVGSERPASNNLQFRSVSPPLVIYQQKNQNAQLGKPLAGSNVGQVNHLSTSKSAANINRVQQQVVLQNQNRRSVVVHGQNQSQARQVLVNRNQNAPGFRAI